MEWSLYCPTPQYDTHPSDYEPTSCLLDVLKQVCDEQGGHTISLYNRDTSLSSERTWPQSFHDYCGSFFALIANLKWYIFCIDETEFST